LERAVLELKLLSLYAFFFVKGTPTILAKAQQLVRERMRKKKVDHVKCFDGNMKYVECYDAKRMSLGYLVELLISLDLSPHDVTAFEGILPWWSMKTDKSEWSPGDDNDINAFSEGSSNDNH